MSSFISLLIYFSFCINFNYEPVRQSIYNRCTYSMKTSGYFISSAAKFTAGMKDCKYNFNGRKTCFMIDSYRYTSSVICYSNRIIFIDNNCNSITVTCKRFIYRIIHYFIHKMMKTSAGCRTNIHTRSFSDCFKSF